MTEQIIYRDISELDAECYHDIIDVCLCGFHGVSYDILYQKILDCEQISSITGPQRLYNIYARKVLGKL